MHLYMLISTNPRSFACDKVFSVRYSSKSPIAGKYSLPGPLAV